MPPFVGVMPWGSVAQRSVREKEQPSALAPQELSGYLLRNEFDLNGVFGVVASASHLLNPSLAFLDPRLILKAADPSGVLEGKAQARSLEIGWFMFGGNCGVGGGSNQPRSTH